MEKGKLFVIFALVIALLFVSCSGEVSSSAKPEDSALASVNLNVQTSDTKDLTVTNDASVITSYEFKATTTVADAKGKSTAFEDYGAQSTGAGTIAARFSPGYWTFTVRGKNSTGGVIYEGKNTVYLAPGTNNVSVIISPVINTQEGLTGTLSINISAPMVSSNQTSTFSLSYISLTDENANSVPLSVPQGSVTRTAEDCNLTFSDSTLAPGLYLLSVSYYENSSANNAISSAVTPFRIIEGTTTTIGGRMEGFLYASVNLSVSKQGLSAALSYNSANTTFTATPGGSGFTNVTYKWYINGTKVSQSGATLNVSSCFGENLMSADAGYYCVTCVVMAENTANESIDAVCCRGHFTINASGAFVDGAVTQ